MNMSSFGFILKESGLDDKLNASLQKHQSELETIFNTAMARSHAINESDTLTSKGKSEARHELVDDISKQLEKFDRLAHVEMQFQTGPSIAKELQQLQEAMKKPVDVEVEPTLEFLRQKEVRDILRQVNDPLKSEAEIRKRCEAGDFSYLDAVLAAPEGSQQFVGDKTKNVLLTKKMEVRNPQAAARIEQLKLAQSRLTGMVVSMKHALSKADLQFDQDAPIEILKDTG